MTEQFYNFYTLTCQNLQETHSCDNKTLTKTIFTIKPPNPEEKCDIIKTLKSSKSTDPNSIPTKILRVIKKSIPLSELINLLQIELSQTYAN